MTRERFELLVPHTGIERMPMQQQQRFALASLLIVDASPTLYRHIA
jgi:hypothetical protein